MLPNNDLNDAKSSGSKALPNLVNKFAHLLLITDKPPRIDFSNSSATCALGANFLIPSITFCLAAASMSPKSANSQLDRWIDKVASKFRARSGKTQEFFDIERQSIGAQAADANVARNLSRELDVDIDKLFPPMRTVFNKQNAKERTKFLGDVNEALVSGNPELRKEGQRRVLNAEGRKLFDESIYSRQGASTDAEDLFIQRIKKQDLDRYTEMVDSNRMVAD